MFILSNNVESKSCHQSGFLEYYTPYNKYASMCKYSLNNIRILSEDSSRSIDLCSLKNNSIIKAFHQIYHFITKFFFLLDYTISIFFQQDLLAVAQTSRLLRGRATVRTTKKNELFTHSV